MRGSTSDIEGQNVHGMHGPKEVKVILIEENQMDDS